MKKILTLTALGALFAASNANASGFHLKEQSASGLGTAYAGSSAGGEDISSSYFNPANLTRYKGTQVSASAILVAPNSRTKYAESNIPGIGAESSGNSGDIVSDAVLPSFYGSTQINDNLTLGMSFNAPFGLVTKYDNDWAGRMHGTLSDVRTYTFTPMLAYKMDEKMSIGIGAQIQHISARLRNGQNLGGGNETGATLHGDTTDAGFVLGALYEWRDDTRFGIGYRSRIHHKLEGKLVLDAVPGMRDINAEITTPAILSLGITHDVNDKWSVMAEFQRTYWSDFDNLNIKSGSGTISFTEENWKNTNFYSIGTSYQLNDALKVRLGLGFDKSAVKKENRTPRIPDSDRNWYSAGMQYSHSEDLTFDLGYTYIRAASTGRVMLDGTKPGDASRGSLYADYKSYVHIVGVGVTYKF